MTRLDREWLLRPILGVLGCGGLVGAQGCGGDAASPHGSRPADTASEDYAAVGGSFGEGANAGAAGAATSGMGGSAGNTGGMGGADVGETTVAIWEYTAGDMPSADPPVPVQCRGIEGAILESAGEQFSLAPGSALAFCGRSLPYIDEAYGLCLPAPPPGQTCAEAYPLSDVASIWSCGYDQIASYVCGGRPAAPGSNGCAGDECCYVFNGGCAVGRPFTVDGRARQAYLVRDASWLNTATGTLMPEVASLDWESRCALADVYSKDALTEHASVASFSRFVLECLAVGAPADIVLEAQQALADEIGHARASFALASAYAGVDLGPSALDVSNAISERVTLTECVRRTFREGCIAETVSAALIHGAADVASDPVVKSVLSRTAEDERRHAVLAWRFVSWAVARGDEPLRALIREEIQRAHEHIGFGALTDLPGDAVALRAHGYLDEAERRLVAMRALDEVVLPSASLLVKKCSTEHGCAEPRMASKHLAV